MPSTKQRQVNGPIRHNESSKVLFIFFFLFFFFAQESLEQWILGDADDEAVAANPTSELENRSLIFQKVQFDRGQLGFYQAFEERLNEAGGQYLRPHALRRGGADTVCRMLLFSLLGAIITTEKISWLS